MKGVGIKLAAFDDFPQIHDGHAVADIFHNAQVMRNKEIGQPEFILQVL